MQIRPCSPDDLVVLRRSWPTWDDVAGAHYAEQQEGSATYLVAWEQDEPWGCAMIQWRGCLGSNARRGFPDCVEVNHLQVREQFRGRGAGTALIAHAEQLVRDSTRPQLGLAVEPTNDGAHRLYQRLGYERTGILDSCAYTWLDAEGTAHAEVETSELLIKQL